MLYRLFRLSVLVLLLAGCADEATKNVEQVSEPQKVYNWRMVTTGLSIGLTFQHMQ